MSSIIPDIPDIEWYRNKSIQMDSPNSCPYANHYKCPRFFDSIDMLGDAGIITRINIKDKKDLDAFWERSGLSPIIAEDKTSIRNNNKTFSNFCPEVSFKHLDGYYAKFLAKHSDDTDKENDYRKAEKDKLSNDYRYEWEYVIACHFLDCSVYNQIHDFNLSKIGKFDRLVHSNVLNLIGRMEQCLESNDPSGVLHAAACIIETAAKDILQRKSLENQTFGSYKEKYYKESKLPNDIKEIVGNIYSLRNIMPLSGHGSTSEPNMNMYDAIIIAAAIKFIVEIEYRMKNIE